MTSCADPTILYRMAVANLVQAIPPAAKAIVVHFDGDAAYEKTVPKFSHNLFLPLVAANLKMFTDLPVHLVISKVDYGTTADKLAEKFCDVHEDGSYRLRVNPTVEKHAYPGHDAPFESVAIVTKALPQPEGKNMYPPTELLNQTMVEAHVQKRGSIEMRACICIGGNTERGIREFGDNFFDNVQRSELEAFGA